MLDTLDAITIRRDLERMGIAYPAGIDDPRFGPDLGMDQLEIRRLRQIIETRLRILLPDDFHISRQDSTSALIAKIHAEFRAAREAFDEVFRGRNFGGPPDPGLASPHVETGTLFDSAKL